MDINRAESAPDLTVDDRTKAGFAKWFRALEEKDRQQGVDTHRLVRFFDQKTFYTVHGDSALFIARQYYRTTAVIKYFGSVDTGLPGVTLNRSLYERVLRDLLVERAEHTVELYEGSGASWTLARSASPGKLGEFEEELFRSAEMSETPVVMAVTVALVEGARMVGVAFSDAALRRLGACEFADDEHFCNLEAVTTQLGAKECVMPKEGAASASAADYRRVRDVLSRCEALPTERDKAAFAAKNLEQDLGRLLRDATIEQHRNVLDRPLAKSALAAVLAFTEVMADRDMHGKYSLELYDTGRYMRLDAAAQRALNVLKSKTDANDNFSLYGLLNRARSAMGKRLLKVWLKQPLVVLEDIVERHDAVEAFATDPELRERLRDQNFRGMPDVERLTRKLERKRCSLADLCQLYRASSKLPQICAALSAHRGPQAELLRTKFGAKLEAAHDEERLVKFEDLLEAAIDLDRIPDEYMICASYDANLEEMWADKDAAEKEIEKEAANVARAPPDHAFKEASFSVLKSNIDILPAARGDLGLELGKTIKLEWHKAANTRLRCLRITSKEEKAVRKQLGSMKYETLETRKDGTKFLSRDMKRAATRLQQLATAYESKQQKLVEEVVGVAHTFVEVWEQVSAVLAELDVLLGFAELAANAPTPYVRPTMLPTDAGEIVLIGSRHPNVEAQEGVDFIPNDCRLVRGESWFQIITGPNMGGKSTYIRQVGVVVLLAQVGCFVPCDEARIAVRDCIFARVGAGDCQLRGVSTFMAEMLETAAILKGATSSSLVIIDELGRGTSTYDGFGLAWAISEHLMQVIGAPTLFATHFHELTGLKGDVGVANLHVETAIDQDSGKLTMLYQVQPGACDQSFGIHVAEFAHFPPRVVELAKRKAEELEDFSEPGITLPEEVSAADAKRKRVVPDDEQKGAARARAFLQEFAALPMDTMDKDEAVRKARALLEKLEADAAGIPSLRAILEAES